MEDFKDNIYNDLKSNTTKTDGKQHEILNTEEKSDREVDGEELLKYAEIKKAISYEEMARKIIEDEELSNEERKIIERQREKEHGSFKWPDYWTRSEKDHIYNLQDYMGLNNGEINDLIDYSDKTGYKPNDEEIAYFFERIKAGDKYKDLTEKYENMDMYNALVDRNSPLFRHMNRNYDIIKKTQEEKRKRLREELIAARDALEKIEGVEIQDDNYQLSDIERIISKIDSLELEARKKAYRLAKMQYAIDYIDAIDYKEQLNEEAVQKAAETIADIVCELLCIY